MLLVDALVLAAGGFAANKQMLQVRPAEPVQGSHLLAGHRVDWQVPKACCVLSPAACLWRVAGAVMVSSVSARMRYP